MRALVGQYAPDSRWYRARLVELEGQPSWTLAQMRAMWERSFQRNTAAMVEVLLRRHWSVLANTHWPERARSESRPDWTYVCGVGRGYKDAISSPAAVGLMGTEEPFRDEGWAYLWEHKLAALHVYGAHGGRWHHLATLPTDVWAGLTTQLVVDVEARFCWLEREEKVA